MRITAFIFLFVVLCSCKNETEDTIQFVSVDEMEVLLKQEEVKLVDVRTFKEFRAGHIKEAQNLDFLSETFETDIQKLDKTKPVVVYCQKGGRSAKCAKKMKELGFVKIYDLDGGYSKWLAENK